MYPHHEYPYPPPPGFYYPPPGHERMPPPPAPYAPYRHPNAMYQQHQPPQRPSSSVQPDYSRRPHQSMPAPYPQHPPPREYDPRAYGPRGWAGPSDRGHGYTRPPSRPQSPIRDRRSANPPPSAFSPTRGQSRHGYVSPRRHSRQGSAGPSRASPERRPQSPRHEPQSLHHRPQSPRHRQSGDWPMPSLAAPLSTQPLSPRRPSPGSTILPPIAIPPRNSSTLAPVTSRSSSTGGSGSAKESLGKSESPVTTPGGTKTTNRMGLGHLMD